MTMPSAQEGRFRFGDKIPQPIDGKQYIFVRYMPHTNPPAIELLCNKPECLWMTEDELAPYLEPADNPGRLVAQQGWRERMDALIGGYEDLCRPIRDDSKDFERRRNLITATAEITTLLDEVVELPDTELKAQRAIINGHKRTYVVGEKGFELCAIRTLQELEVASALIAAAREGKAE